jgi:hypothetical protein
MSVVALDLDGTLIESRWPGMGEWFPGAKEAVHTLLNAGHSCYIFSARTSSAWPDKSERTPAQVYLAISSVRTLLDDAGLYEVSIWDGVGKPFWDLLVDDKALYHPGGPRSWRITLPKILARVRDEDTFTRVMDVANAE